VADPKISHRWEPIQDLPADLRGYRDSELQSLFRVWSAQRETLSQVEALAEYNRQLVREWAVETGIIEGVYTLDRGITRMLIDRGIAASLIPRDATNLDPELVAKIIQAHAETLEGLFAFVKSERPFGTSYIRELHAALLKYQDTTTAFDQFGDPVLMQLHKGAYKTLPNNPTREDGTIHEYCPPEHVSAEMDRLVALHAEHERDQVSVETEAAWVHHAFAQIHPFQDGNGRVARAIASLVLIRPGFFPYVVTREDRARYIASLEAADGGDLRRFIEFSSILQKRILTKAIGLAVDAKPANSIADAITSTRDLLVQLGRIFPPEWLRAKANAARCAQILQGVCNGIVSSLGTEITRVDSQYQFQSVGVGGIPPEFTRLAEHLQYEPNFSQYGHTQRILLKTASRDSDITVSLHGIGAAFRGVIAAAAYFNSGEGLLVPLSDDIFRISYEETVQDIDARFRLWLEACLAKGIVLWRRTLV